MARKLLIIYLSLILAPYTCAKPAYETPKIISYSFKPNDGSGNYYFMYHTSDGSMREEQGTVENGNLIINGRYAYEVDNKMIKVTYKADESGYHVVLPPSIEQRIVKTNQIATTVLPETETEELPDRYKPPEEPLDEAVICSLLGRCTEEQKGGNVNREASV